MSELRNRSIFVDVSLFCGNRVFPAHRVVVAAASGYLNRVLRLTNNSPHDSSDPRGRNVVIVLPPSIKPELLALAVEFMYSGEISLDSGDLEEFMRVADALEIRGLRRGSAASSSEPPLKRPKLSETLAPATPAPSVVRTPTPSIRTPSPAPSESRPESVEIRSEKPDRPAIPELKSLKTEQVEQPALPEVEEENFDEVGPDTDDETDRKPAVNHDQSSQPTFPGPSCGSVSTSKVQIQASTFQHCLFCVTCPLWGSV